MIGAPCCVVDAGTLVVAGALQPGGARKTERIRARSASACAQPAVPIATGIRRPGRRAVATSRGIRVFTGPSFLASCTSVDRATCSFEHIPKYRIRDSPDDSRTGLNSSDFLASLEARRELPAATRTTGG
jgi:hypothetical protein